MIRIIKDDITNLDVDIIVNAANKTLLGGGGVDGAIHRKAGNLLLEECKKLNGCNTGEAKMTDAYNLKCKKIIHTVGPVYYDGLRDEEKLLELCYKNSLLLALQYKKENNKDFISIAFPCISTGVYHFPLEKASSIAIKVAKEFDDQNIEIVFCTFSDYDYELYNKGVL